MLWPTGTGKSTQTADIVALLGIGPLANRISVQIAQTYYWIKDVHGVKCIKEGGPKKLIIEGVLWMPSEETA